MKCYCCQSDLIWGGDEDTTDDETDDIVTNLSCPECGAFVLVYWGQKEKEENDQARTVTPDAPSFGA
jgi:hypothetical protein